MRYLAVILLLITSLLVQAQEIDLSKELAREEYYKAFQSLKNMLNGSDPMSFKKAVFTVENAYMSGQLDYERFNDKIQFLTALTKNVKEQHPLLYDYADREAVEVFGSVFLVMTDTVVFEVSDGEYGIHLPYKYDFEDFFGDKDWSKMFVTKLLESGTGNCHSMPFLYKILAEELGETAYLALAPNHTYIKLRTNKIGWFNTELTSATFPIDAWIMASGYIHLNAVQNGIYMDTLSLTQSIALTMTDLANGYEKKFGSKDNPEFLMECLDVALQYFPNYVNAMLSKAETMKTMFEKMMQEYGVDTPNELLQISEPRALFLEMEQLYKQIHQLGYRRMPKKMYLTWLEDLQRHQDKYVDKRIIDNLKSESK